MSKAIHAISLLWTTVLLVSVSRARYFTGLKSVSDYLFKEKPNRRALCKEKRRKKITADMNDRIALLSIICLFIRIVNAFLFLLPNILFIVNTSHQLSLTLYASPWVFELTFCFTDLVSNIKDFHFLKDYFSVPKGFVVLKRVRWNLYWPKSRWQS